MEKNKSNDNMTENFDAIEEYFKEPEHLAGTVKPKMSPRHRAKQFAPFAAVTGLDKALRDKERKIEESFNK